MRLYQESILKLYLIQKMPIAGNMLYVTDLKNVIARFRPGAHPFQGVCTEFLGGGSYFRKTSASCLKSEIPIFTRAFRV